MTRKLCNHLQYPTRVILHVKTTLKPQRVDWAWSILISCLLENKILEGQQLYIWK